jgi:TRAP-type mannitol/chloroaromatic compound transport system permease large subunit
MEAAVDSPIILFIVSALSAFSWMLTSKEIPQTLTDFVFSAIGNPTGVVLAIIGLPVILGLFMNPTPGLLLSVPLLTPIAQKLNMDLVQFGESLPGVTQSADEPPSADRELDVSGGEIAPESQDFEPDPLLLDARSRLSIDACIPF